MKKIVIHTRVPKYRTRQPKHTKQSDPPVRRVAFELFVYLKSGEFYFAMIVAVPFMRMMKMSIYQVINVIAMGNGFVSAFLSMNVSVIMTGAVVATATIEAVLVDMISMLMMKMTIMEIVDMIAMRHSSVSACARMLVIMLIVCLAVTH
ncbi:MAG: hypothetical protein K2X93_14045 [Candidatus Obscuribacterales bacterium]|nr:hypothetical protein [Candidatus Obscuribacterales bacterium]